MSRQTAASPKSADDMEAKKQSDRDLLGKKLDEFAHWLEKEEGCQAVSISVVDKNGHFFLNIAGGGGK